MTNNTATTRATDMRRYLLVFALTLGVLLVLWGVWSLVAGLGAGNPASVVTATGSLSLPLPTPVH